MALQTAFLLNPPKSRRRRKRRGRRKARRTRNAWRGQSRRHAAAARKGHRRRAAKKSRRRRRRRNSYLQVANPRYAKRRGRKKRRRNKGYGGRRRRAVVRSRRRRNPDAVLAAVPQVLPIKIPLPGILGQVSTAIVQGIAAGGIVFAGYLGGGMVVSKVDEAMGETLAGQFRKPVLYALTAAGAGALFAAFAPSGKKMTWGILGAAGPGLRAVAGVVTALIPADATGVALDIRTGAEGLSDYLQVEGAESAPMGEELYEAGMEDYLQVDGVGQEIYEAGMEDIYEAGLGQEEEEVIGI